MARRLQHNGTTIAVYAALGGNLLVAATKAAAAAWTGSAAMTSEAIHSLVDTLNEILLLYGIRLSSRAPDLEHPLGYGRELYFWSFIVALLVFALGAVVSFSEGAQHILHPEPIRDPTINYVVLAAALVIEGASWVVSYRQFNSAKGDLKLYDAFRRSKDPPAFLVLFEDSAAIVGILVAAGGTFAAATLHEPAWDGVASIAIGLILAITAGLLARESKSLLIGEQADPALMASILTIARAEDGIIRANGLLTVQLAPDQVIAALSLEFADDMLTTQIEDEVVALEQKVRAAHPEIVGLFVKPQTSRTFEDWPYPRLGYKPPD